MIDVNPILFGFILSEKSALNFDFDYGLMLYNMVFKLQLNIWTKHFYLTKLYIIRVLSK